MQDSSYLPRSWVSVGMAWVALGAASACIPWLYLQGMDFGDGNIWPAHHPTGIVYEVLIAIAVAIACVGVKWTLKSSRLRFIDGGFELAGRRIAWSDVTAVRITRGRRRIGRFTFALHDGGRVSLLPDLLRDPWPALGAFARNLPPGIERPPVLANLLHPGLSSELDS